MMPRLHPHTENSNNVTDEGASTHNTDIKNPALNHSASMYVHCYVWMTIIEKKVIRRMWSNYDDVAQ